MSKIGFRLTKIKDTEPINALSFIAILFLDIFVLVNLFIGLENHTDQMSKPSEYIPQICREIVIQDSWSAESRIRKLSSYLLHYDRRYYKKKLDTKVKHPICERIIDGFDDLKINKELIEIFKEREKLQKKYITFDNFQKNLNDEAKVLLTKIEAIDKQINDNDAVKQFWQIIAEQRNFSAELKSDLRKLNYIFPLKKLLFEMLFLLPLFAVLLWWNSISFKKERALQSFISSHLIVVTFIPIFITICKAVFEIIPDKLFKELIDFLESLKLIAFWHYFLVVLAILVSLLVIYLFQNKVFTKKRLIKRRLIKKQCVNCGKKLLPNLEFCPFCGEKLKITCGNCNEETYKGSEFCINCGERME